VVLKLAIFIYHLQCLRRITDC